MNNRLGYSFQHGPRLENESRKNDSTQVCTRSQLGDDVRKHWDSQYLHQLEYRKYKFDIPFP